MFSPVETVSSSPHSTGKLSKYNYTIPQEFCNISSYGKVAKAHVEILEQPVSIGARFRYKCEGRSAGCIRGINSTDKQKTYPTIKIYGYEGAAAVVVSCITKDGPPYYPHPHNLVGKACTNGVCYKSINTPDMICNFSNLGIQCVKKKDIKESLLQRKSIQVDPFGTGFSHCLDPSKINLNALRLCFQVLLPNDNGKLCIPLLPVMSNPIYDNKTISDLTITKLSHYSAHVSGGQEMILLCDQVNKDDIQVVFYEEVNQKINWYAHGKFSPHHVHRKVAISFETPPYNNLDILEPVSCFIQLRRPSDGAVGKPRTFTYIPLKQDPEGLARKRNKFEALRLERTLQPNNLPDASPRLIKQAVRPKASGSQNNFKNDQQRGFVLQHAFESHTSAQVAENIESSVLHSPKCNFNNAIAALQSRTVNKEEEVFGMAKSQMNNPQDFVEPSNTSDEALDRLRSLDLGIDPSELDVNLSNITLDSFSTSSGMNFSLSMVENKLSTEKFVH